MTKNDYIHLFCEAVKIGYFLRDQYLADKKYYRLSKPVFESERDERICEVAVSDGIWGSNTDYVQEAKRRGLDCGVTDFKNRFF